MYYHRLIINLKKQHHHIRIFFIYLLIFLRLEEEFEFLSKKLDKILTIFKYYIIVYGIFGHLSDVDADKVYDANQKKILNVALDKNSDSSVATVKMVKDIISFTKTICTENILKNFTTLVMQEIIN